MRSAPAVRVGVLALCGASLLAWPAHLMRIDLYGDQCTSLPPSSARLSAAAVYAVALALLGLAWREALRAELPLRTVFALAAAVHAVSMIYPPFLSADPLFYAACGKALAAGAGHLPLDRALPGDSWLDLMGTDWREGSSPYFAGFNQLSGLVARVAGDDLGVALRAYQLIGALCTFGTAALLVRAFDEPRDRARAAALVLFSPLAILEATQNGHNDALLMLSVALFAWATVRGRALAALPALAVGLLVKASSLLLLGFELLRRALAPARRLLTPSRVLIAGTALVLVALAAFVAVAGYGGRVPALRTLGRVVGSPEDAWEHCTRSVECLPRALFRYIFGLPRAAWVTSLVFRAAGALWLLWAAARASVSDSSGAASLRWISTALFIYYLLFHGYMESWYLLSLLPLSAFAMPFFAPVMRFFMLTAVAYYPLDLLFGCSRNPVEVGSREFFGAFITIAVPGLYLIARAVRHRRSAA